MHLNCKVFDQTDRLRYNSLIYSLLNQYKTRELSENELYQLQMRIEDLTTKFDESNIFSETPNLIKLLIGKDLLCAKDYLYRNLPINVYNSTIDPFGQYTLEAIIIHVLGLLYNSIEESSVVRVSTLLDTLDRTVRTQANIIKKKELDSSTSTSIRVDSSKDNHQKDSKYEIGIKLLEFMIERKLIYIESISQNDTKAVVKEKGQGYLKTNLFAICNFELSLLPLKLNLPMVSPPLNWEYKSELDKKNRFMLSDMIGGYLSRPTLDIYNRFSLISSRNLSNFNIEINDSKSKELCFILNGLQKQEFQINNNILEFIKNNRATLEKVGLLMPEKLAHVNMKEAYDLIRISYFKNNAIKDAYSLSVLLKEFAIRVQKARYEEFIIRLASAYDGYVFYLPAFMDFRGRIYRSGILHFHERDLARSLIVFANNHQEGSLVEGIVATSAAFKYKKFDLYDDAIQWYKEKHSLIHASDESLISFAKDASDPFQFIAKALSHDRVQELNRLPITQDAAASAYQIMSYLLLNEEMARNTNLIPHPDGKIQDVYMSLLKEFKVFLHQKVNDKLKIEIIESRLDRKLLKSLFMPLIYGKTLISMDNDIRVTYGQLLSRKDSFNLAKLSYEFWNYKYPDIVNLMKLITIISWFCSVKDRAVVYRIPYLTTIQDYMSFDKEVIMVYEKHSRKKRRVTLLVPTTKRDRRKTQASSCVNFIHQKDAYIAMKVIESLLRERAPIYTVHDNFITTPPYVRIVPDIYTKVFINMGHPLKIINELIRINLIDPYYHIDKDPMSSDNLTDFLKSLLPEKSINKKIWEKKVSELVKYYNNYVEAVCGNQVIDSEEPSELHIEEKWNQFKTLIEKRSQNYSVHY